MRDLITALERHGFRSLEIGGSFFTASEVRALLDELRRLTKG